MVFWRLIPTILSTAYVAKKVYNAKKTYDAVIEPRSSGFNSSDISKQKEIQKIRRTKIRKEKIYKLLLDYRKIKLLDISNKNVNLVGIIEIESKKETKFLVTFSSLDKAIYNFQKVQEILLGNIINNKQKINSQYKIEFQDSRELIDKIDKKAILRYGEFSGIDIYIDYVDYVEELDLFIKILEKESMRINGI